MSVDEKAFKVLLIEDDVMIQSVGSKLLQGRGIAVIAATTLGMGRDSFLHNQDADVIFMDGCVPGNVFNTGPLIKEIRESGFTGPIIATSSMPDTRQAQMHAGCSHSCGKIEAFDLIASWQDDPAQLTAARVQSGKSALAAMESIKPDATKKLAL